jgi:hypothetical protein
MLHRVRALEWLRAYAGNDFPRVPLELDAGQEADVSDEMLAVLIDAGKIELVDPELPVLETKPEPVKRRRRV